MIHMLPSRTLSKFSPIHLLSFVLVVFVSLAASPPASQAQPQPDPGFESTTFNFCTIFQRSPRTEDARSAAIDEWNASNDSWESQNRVIQEFEGGTLDSLFVQELVDGAWTDTSRVGPEYDASDRLTLCTVKTSSGNGFQNAFRTDLQYNNAGRLDTLITEIWNTNDGRWVDFRQSSFKYDSNGNDTLEVVEGWNIPNQTWENFRRFQRMYDSQNRFDLVRRESWNGNTDTWERDVRIDVSYLSDSREEIRQTWNGADWVNEERQTTMLNSSNLPTETLTEDWDGSDWMQDERNLFAYTTHESTQKFEEIETEVWDDTANEWDNESRTRLSYTSIIPVELARFERQRIGEGAVQLTWQTASETNNSGFEVQRQTSASPSGSWNTVQFVEGAGTTSEPQSYRFTDRAVPFEAETVRYRLRQVDLDGSAQLSKTVEVRLGAPEQLALHAPFPNPSRNETTVRYELPASTEVQIAVYDVLGRRVATPVEGRKNAGRSEFQLRTQQLPSGTYILRLQAAEQTRTQRLTVVK
jgi:hypothetical protein